MEDIRISTSDVISVGKFYLLGQLTSSVVHEINNPLSVLNGRIYQAERLVAGGAENLSKLSEVIKKSQPPIEQISDITKSLRLFAQSGSGETVSAIRVNALIANCLDLIRGKFKNNNIDLVINEIPENLEVKVKPSDFSYIILSLLRNAHDAVVKCENKTVQIDFQKNDEGFCFYISNSGPQIDVEINKKIFMPFFTTKTDGQSIGLGLFVSREIIQQMGGSLTLDPSRPTTCFKFVLPAK